jgi:hypothetical protein
MKTRQILKLPKRDVAKILGILEQSQRSQQQRQGQCDR